MISLQTVGQPSLLIPRVSVAAALVSVRFSVAPAEAAWSSAGVRTHPSLLPSAADCQVRQVVESAFFPLDLEKRHYSVTSTQLEELIKVKRNIEKNKS